MIPDFEAVQRWCQSYLELQYSRDVGRQFTAVLKVLGAIAGAPQDGVDRFDWLKQQEQELTYRLQALSDAFAAYSETQHREQSLRMGSLKTGNSTNLFVYGTLKRGHRRSSALESQRFLGVARTLSQYRIYDCGGYPGLVHDAHGKAIEGELWEIDAACLAHLDDVEGVHLNLYQRQPVLLDKPFQNERAESYFYCRSVAGLRDCGTSWRDC